MKRSAPLIGAFVATIALAVFAAPAAPAAGLDPAPAEKAQLIYTNGGRLVQIDADGSDRKVLTYDGYMIPGGYGGGLGDHRAEVSPDGSKLLFTRYLDDSGDRPEPFFMVSGRDGSDPRRILRNRDDVTYRNPAWMPDGSIVATRQVTGKRRVERSVVLADGTGANVKTLLNLKPHLTGSRKRDRSADIRPVGLSPSPDGGRIMISMFEGDRKNRRWLEMADLASGRRWTVSRQGHSGDWSPDGSKIVVSAGRPSDLYVADATGEDPVRITHLPGSEESPAWSPDGSRIAFSSNRNVPGLAAAAEIYSARPDGRCLTWLTNGSPASVEPSWDVTRGDTDPGGCGPTPRGALAEVEPLPRTWLPMKPRLWAGSNSGGRLLTGDFEFLGIEFFEYEDCAFYSGADCAPPAAIFSLSSCLAAGSIASTFGDLRGTEVRVRRGALTLMEGPRSPMMLVFAGGAISYAMAGSGKKGPEAIRRARRETLRLFSRLRPVGSEKLPRHLPAFRVPTRDLRRMKMVSSSFRRTGSLLKTAKRLDLRRSVVRDNLFMAKTLGGKVRVKQVRCPNLTKLLGFSGENSTEPPAEISEKADELGIRIPRWSPR
ncbi:MAG TPA: hypothetical protein VMF31_04630 [Solirubrobacterales bacterium]|nr:hypothetical protein [Solirubrobacterales bacterium]